MASFTTPTEMVAGDQLFKAALQQSNTAIADKQNEFADIMCAKGYSVTPNLNCEVCPLHTTCVGKTRIEILKQELKNLTDERLQLMQKYSELQDSIKNYLLS